MFRCNYEMWSVGVEVIARKHISFMDADRFHWVKRYKINKQIN